MGDPRVLAPSIKSCAYKGVDALGVHVAIAQSRTRSFQCPEHQRRLRAVNVNCVNSYLPPRAFPAKGQWVPVRKSRARAVGIRATASPRDINDAAALGSAAPVTPADTASLLTGPGAWLNALYRFSRPHTMIGTTIAICSVSLLAADSLVDFTVPYFIGILQALIPSILMNVYIVGLNQIYDVEIDKLNKPDLPMASGEFSMKMGVVIIAVSAALSLAIGSLVGSAPLMYTLVGSMILGSAYSLDLPLLRWKRFPVLAAACILAVRAFGVQLGFYWHTKGFVLGRLVALTEPLVFTTSFMCLFSIVIALFKDIPDVEGDRIFGMRSFSVRMGQAKIFWLCIAILTVAYGGAIAVGLSSPVVSSKIFMTVGHLVLAALLLNKARTVDLKSRSAIYSCYMFVWKLFYAEYLLIPFFR